MSDESSKGIIHIESGAGTASEPAHVSILIDGDRKYTVRTSDLENIGAQLRGKHSLSAASIALTLLISVLTVAGTTLVAQIFQHISWSNQAASDKAKSHAERAIKAFEKASLAISQRYYSTSLYFEARRHLISDNSDAKGKLDQLDQKLDQQRYIAFQQQLKNWNETYDQMLTTIEYSLDEPVLKKFEQNQDKIKNKQPSGQPATARQINLKSLKFKCTDPLLEQTNKLELGSLRIQFAALNNCFDQSIEEFKAEMESKARGNNNASDDTVTKQYDNINVMANEFRCFAQHRIGFLEKQKQASIFSLWSWLYDSSIGLIVEQPNVTEDLEQTARDCDFDKASTE
jgi:hypothetical protein